MEFMSKEFADRIVFWYVDGQCKSLSVMERVKITLPLNLSPKQRRAIKRYWLHDKTKCYCYVLADTMSTEQHALCDSSYEIKIIYLSIYKLLTFMSFIFVFGPNSKIFCRSWEHVVTTWQWPESLQFSMIRICFIVCTFLACLSEVGS